MNASAPDSATEAVLLRRPRDGTPAVVADRAGLAAACAALAAGSGPVAIDTERASGYRYWPRAYLVQLRRNGAGTHLIDPIALDGDVAELADTLHGTEWVLHAASQDLPCLAELGLRPDSLVDTELAARLAGYERVALGTMVEQLLGFRLQKGHSAADWSRRPLPAEWLDYAALDVELLLPLADRLEDELRSQRKWEWARQEFAAVAAAPPPAPRSEPWRRTSGIHKIRSPRTLATVRALWEARDALARKRDRAPGRVLPDSAIIDAARRQPTTVAELRDLPVFGGRMQRKLSARWMQHIDAARALDRADLPDPSPATNGPPPASRWADRDPAAAARLAAARAALTETAERNGVPVENLLLPDLMRRLCWSPPGDASSSAVAAALRAGGARPWQVELTAERLSEALTTGNSADPTTP